MPMHFASHLGGGKWRACGCYGRASRHLEDAYVLACTQACTPMHWHALSPVPYALCITISSSFGWFCPDFGSVHATCTSACMPARQNLHPHLRASYILLICMVESIPRAYTRLSTRGTDVCKIQASCIKLRLNHHKHYECTSSGSEESPLKFTDKKYQTTYSH